MGFSLPSTSIPASGSVFPIGTTIVTTTTKDAQGRTGSKTFTVSVKDTTPPVVTVPLKMSAISSDAAGAPVTFNTAASDLVDGEVKTTATPASGSVFPIGITTVTVKATDAARNTGTNSFTVLVHDRQIPLITVPADITLEASCSSGALVTFTTSAIDCVSGKPCETTCVPPSGAMFPLGTTVVKTTSSSASGGRNTNNFKVTVRDSTPPTMTVPNGIRVAANGNTGSIVTFTTSANDMVSGEVKTIATPASGSFFPIGVTPVTVRASDAASNSATKTFNVTVTSGVPVQGADLALHLDASVPSTLVTDMSKRVSRWIDVDSGPNYVAQTDASASQQPAPNKTLTNMVVDFGPYVDAGGGQWMQFKDSSGNDLHLTKIRSVFVVMKGGMHLLGDDAKADFHRGGSIGSATSPIWTANTLRPSFVMVRAV